MATAVDLKKFFDEDPFFKENGIDYPSYVWVFEKYMKENNIRETDYGKDKENEEKSIIDICLMDRISNTDRDNFLSLFNY